MFIFIPNYFEQKILYLLPIFTFIDLFSITISRLEVFCNGGKKIFLVDKFYLWYYKYLHYQSYVLNLSRIQNKIRNQINIFR